MDEQTGMFYAVEWIEADEDYYLFSLYICGRNQYLTADSRVASRLTY